MCSIGSAFIVEREGLSMRLTRLVALVTRYSLITADTCNG